MNLGNVRFPKLEGETPELVSNSLLGTHSGIAAQFADVRAEMPWVSFGCTQFSSTTTVGRHWVLMSHAAGAIDTRGMTNTMSIMEAFVPSFLATHSDGDYSVGKFAYVERLSQTILDINDKLIAGSYFAFRDFDVWRAWLLAWNLGVMQLAGNEPIEGRAEA